MGDREVTRALLLCAAFEVPGCRPALYEQPVLPASQLALVTVESRARVSAVDGLPLAQDDSSAPIDRFWVSAACHELTVTYEESYVKMHGGVFIVSFNPVLAVIGVAGTVASHAANTTVRSYETDTPVRFHVPAKAGKKYWLTSSFDGDVFMPRIAVLDAADERIAVILPDEPCPGATTKH